MRGQAIVIDVAFIVDMVSMFYTPIMTEFGTYTYDKRIVARHCARRAPPPAVRAASSLTAWHGTARLDGAQTCTAGSRSTWSAARTERGGAATPPRPAPPRPTCLCVGEPAGRLPVARARRGTSAPPALRARAAGT
jgi:hypothetical protein